MLARRYLILLLAVMIIGSGETHALTIARSIQIQNIATTKWALIAVGAGQTPSTAPYILRWSVSTGTAYDFFTFQNIGMATLNGFRTAITQRRLTGNSPANEIYFERCVGGVWNPATTLCSGFISLVGKASDGLLLFSNLTLLPNAMIEMRARTLPNNQSTFETTLSAEVSRSNVRAAQVSSS